jgi:hypothetical protein
MSFKPPQPFRTRLEGGVNLTGLPTTYTVNVGTLPTIRLAVDSLPMIQLSIEKIPKVQLGIDPVELRLTEFPSIRGHLPADFCVGLSLLGLDLATIRLCGEAQIITEPYRPNPCEICGPSIPRQAQPVPEPVPQPVPAAPAEPAVVAPANRPAARRKAGG